MRDWMRVLRRVTVMAFRFERRRTVISLILVAMLAGVTAATGFAQRWLVDAAGMGAVTGVLAAAALGAVAFGLATIGFRLQGNLRGDVSHHVAMRLSQEVASNAAAIPRMAHLEHPAFLDRIVMVRRGTYSIASAGWAMAETFSQMVSLGLSVWLLATVHPILMLAVLFSAVPLYTANRGRRAVQRAADETAEAERTETALHHLCIEPEPAKEIRTARSGAAISDRADQIWGQALHHRLVAQLRSAALQFSGWLLYIAGFIAALSVTAVLVIDQRASIGDMVLVVFLAGQLRGQLSWVVIGVVQIGEGGRAIGHFQWFADYATEARSAGDQPAPTRLREGITLEEVSFRYPGTDTDVLSEVDLHLPAGSTVAIVGINGAGKSTLVKLLTGMYEPTAGSVRVEGVDLNRIDPVLWRERTTGTFQDHMKFQFKTFEAVGVGQLLSMADRAAVKQAVHDAGGGAVIDSLPQGLDTQLGRVFDGVELSHGQWQRLALARGRMRREPLLIVLDEPTAALDPQAEHDIYERYTEQASATARSLGTITVMVSHRFSTVSMADQIVVLDEGAVVETGTHTDLLAAGGSYAHHYRTQQRGYQQ